jgi:hypothetical protein
MRQCAACRRSASLASGIEASSSVAVAKFAAVYDSNRPSRPTKRQELTTPFAVAVTRIPKTPRHTTSLKTSPATPFAAFAILSLISLTISSIADPISSIADPLISISSLTINGNKPAKITEFDAVDSAHGGGLCRRRHGVTEGTPAAGVTRPIIDSCDNLPHVGETGCLLLAAGA